MPGENTLISNAQTVFNAIAGAGQGSTAAMALAGATGLLVAGVGAIAYEVKEHEEKAFLEEAHEVQDLKAQCMPNAPDIFTFDKKDGKLASAKSLVLNQAMRQDLATDKSQDDDSFLLKFKELITESMKVDLQFFDERKSETDVTASVLTWIMEFKNKHILNFEGYEKDLQILDQLIAFMTGFISIGRKGLSGFFKGHDPHDRERFMLVRSIQKLKEARKLLENHRNSRTMKDFVSEMMSVSNKDFIPELRALFIEGIIATDEWGLIRNALEDDLRKGELRPEAMRHGLISIFSKKKKPISIPESIFKDWLQRNLDNAKEGKISDQTDYRYSENDLKEIKNVFKICDNIFTRKSPQRESDGKRSTDRFVPVGHDESCYALYVDKLPIVREEESYYLVRDLGGWSLYETDQDLEPVKIAIKDVPGLAKILEPSKGKLLDLPVSKSHREDINKVITAYRNHKQLISRVDSIALEAMINEMMEELGASSKLLSDAVRDLGVIYMENPHHCNFIISGYKAFGEAVKARVNALLQNLDTIEEEQKEARDLLLGAQYDMEVGLRKKLTEIREKVTVFMDNIVARHNAHANSIGDPKAVGTNDPAEYDKKEYQENSKRYQAIKPLMTMMLKLCKKYKLVLDQPGHMLAHVSSNPGLKPDPKLSLSLVSPLTPINRPATPLTPLNLVEHEEEHKKKDSGGVLDHLLTAMHLKHETHKQTASPGPKIETKQDPVDVGSKQPAQPRRPQSPLSPINAPNIVPEQAPLAPVIPIPQPKNQEEKKPEPENKADLASLLIQVQTCINKISQQEKKPDADILAAYNKLYTSLASFESKSKALMLEKDPERQKKGEELQKLGRELAQETFMYLSKLDLNDLKARKLATAKFNDEVNETLGSLTYKNVIDEHKSLFRHFLRAVKQVVLCLCFGYGIIDAVKQGGFAITASRAMVNQVKESVNTLETRIRRR